MQKRMSANGFRPDNFAPLINYHFNLHLTRNIRRPRELWVTRRGLFERLAKDYTVGAANLSEGDSELRLGSGRISGAAFRLFIRDAIFRGRLAKINLRFFNFALRATALRVRMWSGQ